MKRMRLLSLAVLPVAFAQCAPSGCAPATPAPAPQSDCNVNYDGCVPNASDVDCAGGEGDGPAYLEGTVNVIGSDVYDLDRDENRVACD
jgi:resuscitation-promoting factor RpfB